MKKVIKLKVPQKAESWIKENANKLPDDWRVDYFPAADTDGHGENISFRIALDWKVEASKLVHSHYFNFATASDVYRCAYGIGLRALMEIAKKRKAKNRLSALLMMKTIADEKRHWWEFETASKGWAETVKKWTDRGDNNSLFAAGKYMRAMYEAVKYHDNPYWRRRYIDFIKENYQHIMDLPEPPVSMDPVDMVDGEEDDVPV